MIDKALPLLLASPKMTAAIVINAVPMML